MIAIRNIIYGLLAVVVLYMGLILKLNEDPERIKAVTCCQNVRTAVECNAITYCIERHWLKIEGLDSMDFRLCDNCYEIVQMTKQEIAKNVTRDHLTRFVSRLCRVYVAGIKKFMPLCDELTHVYFREFELMLRADVRPEVICFASGICPNRYQFMSTCTLCKLYSDQAFLVLAAKPDRENFLSLGQLLKNYCVVITFREDVCEVVIRKNYNFKLYARLIDMLKRHELCEVMPHCLLNSFPKIVKLADRMLIKLVHDQSPVCQICQVLFNSIRLVLTRFDNFDEYVLAIAEICRGTFDPRSCHILLADNRIVSRLYLLLRDENLGGSVCLQMYQCRLATRYDLESGPEPKALITADDMMENFAGIDMLPPDPIAGQQSTYLRRLKTKLVTDDAPVCLDGECSSTFPTEGYLNKDTDVSSDNPNLYVSVYADCLYVRYMIETNVTRIGNLRAICERLGTKLIADECEAIVSIPVAVNATGIDTYREILLRLAQKCAFEVNVTAVRIADKDCVLCLFMVQLIEDFLERGENVTALGSYLDRACRSLIGITRRFCLMFVREHAVRLAIEYYAETIPKNLCETFYFCE